MSAPQHPAKMREFARRAYAKGHTPYRIRKFLIAQGYDPVPAVATIFCWVDPDYREVERLRKRRPGPRGRKRPRAWKVRLQRLRQLRGAGLSYTALVAICRVDFGIDVSECQVRGIFNGQTSERTIAQLLYPPGAAGQPKVGGPPGRRRKAPSSSNQPTKGTNP